MLTNVVQNEQSKMKMVSYSHKIFIYLLKLPPLERAVVYKSKRGIREAKKDCLYIYATTQHAVNPDQPCTTPTHNTKNATTATNAVKPTLILLAAPSNSGGEYADGLTGFPVPVAEGLTAPVPEGTVPLPTG